MILPAGFNLQQARWRNYSQDSGGALTEEDLDRLISAFQEMQFEPPEEPPHHQYGIPYWLVS